jgi:hypothetical protein
MRHGCSYRWGPVVPSISRRTTATSSSGVRSVGFGADEPLTTDDGSRDGHPNDQRPPRPVDWTGDCPVATGPSYLRSLVSEAATVRGGYPIAGFAPAVMIPAVMGEGLNPLTIR